MTTPTTAPKPRTLVDIFFHVVESNKDPVMLYENGGKWNGISSADLYRRVLGTAKALRAWGVGSGDRVVILSENRPEWTIADFAILLLGAATVPIYATLTADQCEFLVRHSGARFVFVSSEDQLRKIEQISRTTPIERIIMMDEPKTSGITPMSKLMAEGPIGRDAEFDTRARKIQPEDLATLIYTSGTTGTPKGAMLTHGNIASNLSVSLEGFVLGTDDIGLSFLPLSHITARHVDFAELFRGVTIAYCPVLDNLPRVLKEIRPTLFVAVPRVYEKIHNGVQRQIGPSGIKRNIYNWAIKVGKRHTPEILAGKRPSSIAWKLANRLVFSKVTDGMGGRARLFISGGAPLGRELAEWYATIGIRIHEGYGLTETSPVIALNTPAAHRIGTVGRPVSNVEVRTAPDGELLVRGPSVFKGYWNMPAETANAFENGWFKTGDIGNLDESGYLSITDRKKDLIKTSGGKFIAPQPIENSLKANPLVGEAAIIGERRRFPAVIILPSFPALEDWAKQNNITYATRQQLVTSSRVKALYDQIVDEVNANLAKYEKLKKVLLIADELSIASGTLTPTMKLRRRNVEALYKFEIEQLYADSALPTDVKAAS